MVERLLYTQEVTGSSPVRSTISKGTPYGVPFLLGLFTVLRRRTARIFIYTGFRVVLVEHKKGLFKALFSNGQNGKIHFTVYSTPFPAVQNYFLPLPNSSVPSNSYCAGSCIPICPLLSWAISNIGLSTAQRYAYSYR